MYLVKKLSTTYLRKKHVLYRCQWKRDVAKKKVFQRYPPKDFCTARYEHKYSQKKFQTSKKNENISFWAHVGPRSAWENSGKCLVLSGEIPSPWQSSIDKNNDCVTKSERGALVRVSDPLSGQCSQRGQWYVGCAGQASDTRTFGGWCVGNRRQKFSIPLRWRKNTW